MCRVERRRASRAPLSLLPCLCLDDDRSDVRGGASGVGVLRVEHPRDVIFVLVKVFGRDVCEAGYVASVGRDGAGRIEEALVVVGEACSTGEGGSETLYVALASFPEEADARSVSAAVESDNRAVVRDAEAVDLGTDLGEEDVRRLEEEFGELDAHSPSAGELACGAVEVGALEAESE